MAQDPEAIKSPLTFRMGLGPMLGAVGFAASGVILQRLFSDVSPGLRFSVQTAIALGIAVPVAGYWRKAPPGAPDTFSTKTFKLIIICAWPFAFAAWCAGVFIEWDVHPSRVTGNYTVPLRGYYVTPMQASIDHLATSAFFGAIISFAVSAFILDRVRQRQLSLRREVPKRTAHWRIALLVAATVAAFVVFGWMIRVIFPATSPGLVNCVQIVVSLAVLVFAARALMRIDSVEKPAVMPMSLRILASITLLSFTTSFFVLVYTRGNLPTQPDRSMGDYTVSSQLKDGGRRYMTPSQSLIDEIAVWTLLGSGAAMFALDHVLKRRAKKQASSAEPPAVADS